MWGVVIIFTSSHSKGEGVGLNPHFVASVKKHFNTKFRCGG